MRRLVLWALGAAALVAGGWLAWDATGRPPVPVWVAALAAAVVVVGLAAHLLRARRRPAA